MRGGWRGSLRPIQTGHVKKSVLTIKAVVVCTSMYFNQVPFESGLVRWGLDHLVWACHLLSLELQGHLSGFACIAVLGYRI